METNTINSFSGTKVSGLLKEVFNRLDNGGLTTVHLDLLLNGKNPYDPVIYAWWEWKLFYKEVLKIGIHEKDYSFPKNLVRFGIFLVLTTKNPLALSLASLIQVWHDFFDMKLVRIENYDAQLTDSVRIVSTFLPKNAIKQFTVFELSEASALQFLHGTISKENRACGISLEEAMLIIMFTTWKKSYPRIVTQHSLIDNYTIPCTVTQYTGHPVTAYTLLTMSSTQDYQISIYPAKSGAWHGGNPIIGLSEKKEN